MCLIYEQSEANVAEIIVSDPDNGIGGYGLTDKGRQQAEEVSTIKTLIKAPQIKICSCRSSLK